MKSKNNILLIVFLVLVAAFVLTKVFRSPALESNLNTDLFRVDTAEVASVRIQPAEQDTASIVLKKKSGEGWTVTQGSRSARLANTRRDALLRALATLDAERMVSRKEEKWDTYQVGDTTGMEVVIAGQDNRELAHWYVGKQSQGATYARHHGESEVYALKGNLKNEFGKRFVDWRDKTFLRVNSTAVNKITFTYPADSSFVLEKKADSWMIGSAQVDSTKVAQYLGRLRSKDLTHFADEPPTNDADVTLTIEGDIPRTIKGWKAEGKQWVLTSSFQDNTYFYDSTFVDDLFIGKKRLE